MHQQFCSSIFQTTFPQWLRRTFWDTTMLMLSLQRHSPQLTLGSVLQDLLEPETWTRLLLKALSSYESPYCSMQQSSSTWHGGRLQCNLVACSSWGLLNTQGSVRQPSWNMPFNSGFIRNYQQSHFFIWLLCYVMVSGDKRHDYNKCVKWTLTCGYLLGTFGAVALTGGTGTTCLIF